MNTNVTKKKKFNMLNLQHVYKSQKDNYLQKVFMMVL